LGGDKKQGGGGKPEKKLTSVKQSKKFQRDTPVKGENKRGSGGFEMKIKKYGRCQMEQEKNLCKSDETSRHGIGKRGKAVVGNFLWKRNGKKEMQLTKRDNNTSSTRSWSPRQKFHLGEGERFFTMFVQGKGGTGVGLMSGGKGGKKSFNWESNIAKERQGHQCRGGRLEIAIISEEKKTEQRAYYDVEGVA